MTYLGTSDGLIAIHVKPVRYCMTLRKLVSAEPDFVDEEPIGVLQVRGEEEDAGRLGAGMRAWAVATLTAGQVGFGQYEVELEAFEDGRAEERCGYETVNWDGDAVLMPAGSGAQHAD